MNVLSKTDHAAADPTLRAVHGEIVRKHAADPQYLKDLNASDSAWTAFLDAETELQYPSPHIDGSFEYACVLFFRTKLMKARADTLRALLIGTGRGTCP